jgi:hypothetical protein
MAHLHDVGLIEDLGRVRFRYAAWTCSPASMVGDTVGIDRVAGSCPGNRVVGLNRCQWLAQQLGRDDILDQGSSVAKKLAIGW